MGIRISTSAAEEIPIPILNPSSKTQESWNTKAKFWEAIVTDSENFEV